MVKSRVTLHDVAALAGVSHQTVSRVINNSTAVRPETRGKVEAAINELGYRPNIIARSMVSGKTRTLGCISPDLTNYVFAQIIESAQMEANRQGFFILTASAPTPKEFKPLLDELLNRWVDGFMILNPKDDDRHALLEPLHKKNIPVVFIKNSDDEEQVPFVVCNDKKGGYLAAKHLIELGHTKIATVLGPRNEECTNDRLDGFHQALEEAGVSPDIDLQIDGNWTAGSGFQAAAKLLNTNKEFTAVFTHNDRMAAGLIRGLREAGYRVPEDFSVIGYDDIPMAAFFDPPLTTIQQPLEQFGKQAARIIIEAIDTPKKDHEQVWLSPRLIERKTCAVVKPRKEVV